MIYDFATYSVFEMDKNSAMLGTVIIKGQELKNQTYVQSIDY